jgi:hypothetical protein
MVEPMRGIPRIPTLQGYPHVVPTGLPRSFDIPVNIYPNIVPTGLEQQP